MLRDMWEAEELAQSSVPFTVGELSNEARGSICKRVEAKHDISFEQANEMLSDLLIFLSASVAFEDALFCPPETIDHVWHEFILHTHAYINFCHSVGVFYIHHVPFDENADDAETPGGRDVREILDDLGISYNKFLWENAKAECYGCDKGIQKWSSIIVPSVVVQ